MADTLSKSIDDLAQAVGADVKALRTDVTALQTAPSGGAGPSGAETVTIDNAAAQTVALSSTAQHKTVRALQPGHTLTMPAAAVGAAYTLAFAKHGCLVRDASGSLIAETGAREMAVCTLTASGWSVSAQPLRGAQGNIATVAHAQNNDFPATCRLSDTTALVSSSRGVTRVVTSDGAGGLTLGPLLSVANGYDRMLLALSSSKAILLWRKYGEPSKYSVLTVSGGTVTAGPEISWDARSLGAPEAARMGPGTYLVTHQLGAAYEVTLWSYDFGTGAVTVSAPVAFAPVASQFSTRAIYPLSATRAVCTYTIGGHQPRAVQIDISTAAPVLVAAETVVGPGFCYMPDITVISPTLAAIVYVGDYNSGGGTLSTVIFRLLNILPGGTFTYASEPKPITTYANQPRFANLGNGCLQVVYGSTARRPGTYAVPVTVVGTDVQVGTPTLIAPISCAQLRTEVMTADAMLMTYTGVSEGNACFANFVTGV